MAFNILLVDDSVTVRSVIAKALNLAGVPIGELHQAGNGQEALQILGSYPVDLVFCDISMPVMDGEQLVETMREQGLVQRIPVIMVSSAGSEPRVARLMELGVRDFVQKPFTPERIREAVDQVTKEASHA